MLEDLRTLTNREWAALKAVRNRLEQMTWQQIYDQASRTPGAKRGVNWERIEGQYARDGTPVHFIRIDGAFRARVIRRGRNMRFLSLHPDHDSAYREAGGEDL